MKNGGKCPICGKGKLDKKIITKIFWYKGFSCPVEDYVIYSCSECKESIVDNKTIKRTNKILIDFYISVNKKLDIVGHICFNTNKNRWCIRDYPNTLCNLCSNRKNGINLNKEQYDILKNTNTREDDDIDYWSRL